MKNIFLICLAFVLLSSCNVDLSETSSKIQQKTQEVKGDFDVTIQNVQSLTQSGAELLQNAKNFTQSGAEMLEANSGAIHSKYNDAVQFVSGAVDAYNTTSQKVQEIQQVVPDVIQNTEDVINDNIKRTQSLL